MALHTAFVNELRHEAANTRKILERIPEDQWNWKPHDKSSTLGKLACHIAELPRWADQIVSKPEFDIVKDHFDRVSVTSKSELIATFDAIIKQTTAILENTKDEEFSSGWTFKRGGVTAFELPRTLAIRNMVLNHIVHHRGQLSVYLRLLNVPVPGMYGPSADEK